MNVDHSSKLCMQMMKNKHKLIHTVQHWEHISTLSLQITHNSHTNWYFSHNARLLLEDHVLCTYNIKLLQAAEELVNLWTFSTQNINFLSWIGYFELRPKISIWTTLRWQMITDRVTCGVCHLLFCTRIDWCYKIWITAW